MNEQVARVHFHPQQFLRAQDFDDEQSYHLSMHRRHNIAHHSWGILEGLDLVVDEVDGLPYAMAGLAVDGFGREIVMPERTRIPTDRFDDPAVTALDVWVAYSRAPGEGPPPGYAACEDGDSFYRWVERPLLRLETGEEGDDSDRRHPPGVRPGDDPFPASRTAPEEGEWLIFLGQVKVDRAGAKKTYSADLDGRPLADLVGARIEAPSGRAIVQIGAERRDDPNRFAVFVPEADSNVDPLPARLSIDAAGDTSIRGNVEVAGDLTIREGALEFPVGTARRADTTPWRIYHHHRSTPDQDTLRLQFERPATGPRGRNRVAIGTWGKPSGGGPEAFQACLVVDDDCNVTIHGNLVVQGQIQAETTVAGQLSEEARRFALGAYMAGVGGAGSPLDILRLGSPEAMVAAISGEPQLRAVAAMFEANLDLARAFVKLITADYPKVLAALGLKVPP